MVQVRRDYDSYRFNTQPPEGGCRPLQSRQKREQVSTHSRLKAAVPTRLNPYIRHEVSTHSRLKAAAFRPAWPLTHSLVSTHSRLKAAVLMFY